MRIYVREQEKTKVNIVIPTAILFNRLTAYVAKKYIENHDVSYNVNFKGNMSTSDINKLFYELKKFKRRYPGLPLVEVETKDGIRVLIKL